MRQSLVSSAETRRTTKRRAFFSSVTSPSSPLTFFITGFTWLTLSFLLGMALILGLVHGTPLPRWLKPMHVHGALVGGILQLAIGGLLLSLTRFPDRKEARMGSRTGIFFMINVATVGLLFSFWLGNMSLAGLAGLLLAGTVLALTKPAWIHFGKTSAYMPGAGWMYRIGWIALLGGLAAAIAMAFHLTDGYYAHARLAHIHLIILEFITVGFTVAVHQLFPTFLEQSSVESPMVRFALWSLPTGFAVLLAAFLMSALWMEMAVGSLLVVGIAFCTFHLIGTWLKTGSTGTAATDHLLIGVFFLLLTMSAGLAMGANYLRNPPWLPIGSLHLVAYTHLAFIGFVTQVICGSLAFFVPELLADARVQNHAKRQAYRGELETIMNRWRMVHLMGMSLGTIALCVLASLTWSVPLASLYVQSTVWIASGLLLVSLALFAVKLTWVIGQRPSQ